MWINPICLVCGYRVLSDGSIDVSSMDKGGALLDKVALYSVSIVISGLIVYGGEAAQAYVLSSPLIPVIGKMPHLEQIGNNEFRVADLLPNLGSPQANWYQNSSVLRSIMNQGIPIKDVTAQIDPMINDGFLAAERLLLQNHNWTLINGFWYPPK